MKVVEKVMRVESVVTSEAKTRYLLIDALGEPVEPMLQYLKYKDHAGAARNTLRAYCYHLKLFFEFLEQEHLEYRDLDLDEMAAFLRWLQNPYGNKKVSPIGPITSSRTARSINIIISAVINFYEYLMQHDDYTLQLSLQLKKHIPGARRGFKDFLYHINRNKGHDRKMLKLKVPKQKPRTLKKAQVFLLQDACCNIRNRFLIQLLWESGMRIGEALALWLEDFEIDARRIHIRDRGELSNHAEIKTACSPRSIDVSADLMNDYLEYIAEYHTDEVDTNHVFIKLSGENKHQPMEYPDVVSLFERLKDKVGFHVTPHMLRHTSLTELRRAGWKEEKLMEHAGHAHVQTTMQMYIHPDDEELRHEWEQAEARMQLAKQARKEDHL